MYSVKNIYGTHFLKKLYNKIPELNNIEIIEIKMNPIEHDVFITFILPIEVDNVPPKWLTPGFKFPKINLLLSEVHQISFNASRGVTKVGLSISKKEDHFLITSKELGISIYAESVYIQQIEGICWVSEVSKD